MRVWVCMIGFQWSHTQINRCSKPSHPNCGWFDLQPIAEDEEG